jgi:hypothetical protein
MRSGKVPKWKQKLNQEKQNSSKTVEEKGDQLALQEKDL